MIHFAAYLIFTLVPLIIIISKCHEIRSIKNKNGCSTLAAIKIYIASPSDPDEHSFYNSNSFNDDHEKYASPAYKFLSYNIYHNRSDD